jgi:hypothetical protein
LPTTGREESLRERPEKTPCARLRHRVVAAAVVLSLLLPSLFLLSPAPDQEICGRWIDLGAHAGLPFNCDSLHFVRLADRPALLLEAGEIRQTRPVYVLASSGFLYAVRTGARALGVSLDDDRRFVLGVVALNLLNLAVLGLSALLMADLMRRHDVSTPWVLLAVTALAANDLVKSFVWTPHTQMLNLLAPIAGLWVLDRVADRPEPGPWRRWSLAGGVAGLAYATFLTGVAALAALRFLRLRRAGVRAAAAAARSAGLLALGAAPALLWMTFVHLWSGGFYSHEVDTYRELVWVADAARERALAERLLERVLPFLDKVTSDALTPFFVFGLVGLVVALWRRGGPQPVVRQAVLLFTILAGFLYLVGVFPNRLFFSLTPLLLVVGTVPLSSVGLRLERRRELAIGIPLALVWVAFQVAKAGPYGER